ncbi:Hypothetical predicted protein [Olea europaea subsp. europaea]|uniref:Uncharacterized protein n=1 Tax=Olea europaea subsp. europaea TaxID=158383 RepID=A0A8S0S0Q6_OLEEU|nr:Hypothetical predicted protein [Olea europaea subsp. europaea]
MFATNTILIFLAIVGGFHEPNVYPTTTFVYFDPPSSTNATIQFQSSGPYFAPPPFPQQGATFIGMGEVGLNSDQVIAANSSQGASQVANQSSTLPYDRPLLYD